VISRYDPDFDKRFLELFNKLGVKTKYFSLRDIRLKNLRVYIEKIHGLKLIPKNACLILISRIDKHLPMILSVINRLKLLFLLLVIPPDPHHSSSSKNIALVSAVNIGLSRLRAGGTFVMIGYTTPRERVLFGSILDRYDYIYIPLYTWRKEKIIEEIPVDPPKILLVSKTIDKENILKLLSLLREVEVKPLIIIGLDKEPREGCNIDPSVVCIVGDTFENIVPKLTTVIVLDTDYKATNIVAQAIGSRRPIITSKNQGIAWVYEDTRLIVYCPANDPETIASKILEILNNIDRFKQASLRTEVSPPKPVKTIEYLLGLIDKL